MNQDSTRRRFLGGTALSASLASLAEAKKASKPVPKAAGRVLGANDRINVAFVGNGMQFLGLLDRGFRSRKQRKNDFEYAAVCDIWEPRLKHAQEQTKALKTYRDYREVLARPDIDGVVFAVPDHWHYPMASQALLAGKDVYLEKPMTYTVAEAALLNNLVGQTKRVLQVGGSGPSTRLYWQCNEYVKSGKMGKILWGLISYNRNTREGMWDYPIPGVGDLSWPDAEVSPGKNLDWNMWLGNARKRPFSKDRYFRWRKYWDYSGGNATDLLYHRLGMLSTVIGFDFPTRVSGMGGVYVQKDREVPDTYMTMIEYPGDYAVNMISCMGNQTSAPMTVYGNWATLQFVDGGGGGRRSQVAKITAERHFQKEFREANGGQTEVTIQPEASTDLIDDWLDCMRSRGSTVYNVKRGYQVMAAIGLGVESYRRGRVLAFDAATGKVLAAPPPHREYLPKEG